MGILFGTVEDTKDLRHNDEAHQYQQHSYIHYDAYRRQIKLIRESSTGRLQGMPYFQNESLSVSELKILLYQLEASGILYQLFNVNKIY